MDEQISEVHPFSSCRHAGHQSSASGSFRLSWQVHSDVKGTKVGGWVTHPNNYIIIYNSYIYIYIHIYIYILNLHEGEHQKALSRPRFFARRRAPKKHDLNHICLHEWKNQKANVFCRKTTLKTRLAHRSGGWNSSRCRLAVSKHGYFTQSYDHFHREKQKTSSKKNIAMEAMVH